MSINTSILGASRRLRRSFGAACVAALALVATDASAANFNPEPAWAAVQQKGAGLSDVGTDGNQTNGREIVGSAAEPAVYFATDATHFYVRLRLDTDPRQGAGLGSFSWGVLIDTDGDPTRYELSLQLSAKNPNQIELFENTTKTGGAKDVAETQRFVEALDDATTDAVGNYRVNVAGSNFGANADYFLDFSVPLTALAAVGVTKATPITIWGGTSSSARRLDLDLAGVDGGVITDATLAFAAAKSDPTTLDGTPPVGGTDTDGDTVPDAVEMLLGTDKTKKDSDGDTIEDNVELSLAGGAGPFLGVDTDGDGTIDARDLDSDNDCASDQIETVAAYRTASVTPDANCSGATPTCNTAKGVCTSSCTTDAQCTGAGRICVATLCTDGCRGGATPKACATGFECSSTDASAGTCKAVVDTDGDGVSDPDETKLGTDPTKKDTDGDGIVDNVELSASGSTGPFTAIDTDKDGTIDAKDLDSDNDCLPDAQEKDTYRDATKPQASASANCAGGGVCDTARGVCGGSSSGGTSGSSGGTSGTSGGTSGTSGGADAGEPDTAASLEGGGLSCAASGRSAGGSMVLLLLGALALVGARRRRPAA